jgi:L,D-transpeptidase ErfK/SrfK
MTLPFLCGLFALLCGVALAAGAPLPVHEVVGSEFDYTATSKDSLRGLASRYGAPVEVLAAMNHLRSNSRLKAGQVLHIDNRHIPPRKLDRGIVVNVPQRMLFFFDPGEAATAYPVAVGKPTWPTHLGTFTVTRLEKDPTWIVPESIQLEMKEDGEEVKTVVPPGPNNPLGDYAIHLSIPGYLLHGTNAPWTIYSFRTHGCIRLSPKNAEALYRRVKVGDPGEIIYQRTMLAGLPDGRVFAEVDKDIYRRAPDPVQALRIMAEAGDLSARID